MNSLISRVQKDLNRFQKVLQKESDDLIKRIKSLGDQAKKSKVAGGRKEIEKLIEEKVRSIEPTLDKLIKDVTVSARKYGIDLRSLEKKIRETTDSAKLKFSKATRKSTAKMASKSGKAAKSKKTKSTTKTTKKVATAKKATVKKVATAKKATAKKATAKKATAKKTTVKKASTAKKATSKKKSTTKSPVGA